MSKPILIEYKDGRTYELESVAVARRVHPDAKVVSYADGTPIEEPKADAPTPATAPRTAKAEAGAEK